MREVNYSRLLCLLLLRFSVLLLFRALCAFSSIENATEILYVGIGAVSYRWVIFQIVPDNLHKFLIIIIVLS